MLCQNDPGAPAGSGAHTDFIHKALHDRKTETGALLRVAGGEQRLHGLWDIRDAYPLSVTVMCTSRSG